MLRPTHAEGEFINVLTFFLIILFNPPFIRPDIVYPNTYQLPRFLSRTLPHERVEFIVGPSLQPLLLVGFFRGNPIFPSS